jgi:hypothetical protein
MAKGFGPQKAPQTTKRQRSYSKLIQALLRCPRGKELKILRKHPDLVDVGLVEMMEMVATIFVAQRDRLGSEFLINLADFIYSSYIGADGSPLTGAFVKAPALLWEVLRIISLNPSDQQTVYLILAAISDELNEDFFRQFCLWIDYTLLKSEPRLKKTIAIFLISFCKMLWLFPLGNRTINLEIAIAGLEGTVKIWTRETYPQM